MDNFIKNIGSRRVGKKTAMFGLFKCSICNCDYERRISAAKSSKSTLCLSCSIVNRSSKLKTHGSTNTKLYKIWENMRTRCLNVNTPYYCNYGARGISICNDWNNYKSFEIWALSNGYKDGFTLDRIDNDGNYDPSNCRFTTRYIQQQNTRLLRKNNISGYRGVCFSNSDKKFISQITHDGKKVHLGSFCFSIDAAKAYNEYVLSNNTKHTLNDLKEIK